MKLLRKLLFPFAALYWVITALRNLFYSTGIFKSFSFSEPIIVVGNLSTGGTGKSPHTEYLMRLLSARYKIATLSRGYRRKTKGFRIAGKNDNADTLGDEPCQFHLKFPNALVAVDADRVHGVQQLLVHTPKPEVIVLDDAYQHRRLKGGFYILLTPYNDLYVSDFVLPAGNLREGRAGAKRANVIIVTKCPESLSMAEQEGVIKKLKPKNGQQVFFTKVAYDDHVWSERQKIPLEKIAGRQKILVAGIAKPQPFFRYLQKGNDICKTYPDHHYFTDSELQELEQLSENRIIITTEKDYMRLKGRLPDDRLFYLPIRSTFLNDGEAFDKTILDYVGKSTGNR